MNEYKIKVNFDKHYIISGKIELVENDYNSTSFQFVIDEKYDEYTKVFELKYPSGAKYIKELEDNSILFENILLETGDYQYEIALYGDDSKLTNYAIGSFEVRGELVKVEDEDIEIQDEYPILDQLIQNARDSIERADIALVEANVALTEANNLNVDAEKVDTKTTVTITKKDGSTKNVEILDGEKGDSGIVVFNIENGHLIATSEGAENLTHYSLENNHLYLEIV